MRRSFVLVVLTSSFAFAQPDGTAGVRDRVAELKERVALLKDMPEVIVRRSIAGVRRDRRRVHRGADD